MLVLTNDVQTSADGQNAMTQAIVAVELLCSEKIIDFKDSSQPTLAQVSRLTPVCEVLCSI